MAETLRQPAEVTHAEELSRLAKADPGPRPPGWSLTPRAVRRFLREVHLATSFVHRYAVTLRDFGRDGGLLYYTMDFVPGATLQQASGWLLARCDEETVMPAGWLCDGGHPAADKVTPPAL